MRLIVHGCSTFNLRLVVSSPGVRLPGVCGSTQKESDGKRFIYDQSRVQLPIPNRPNCSDSVPTSAFTTPNLEDRTRQSY